ncbi:MAG: hypothetical protein JNM83_13910 [Myxococcales bacterium]|nr:hypothetical protein [Myxococcales bacterium]
MSDQPDKPDEPDDDVGSASQPDVDPRPRSGARRRGVTSSGSYLPVSSARKPAASGRPPVGKPITVRPTNAKNVSRKRQRGRLAELASLPGKLPEKIGEGLERGISVTANALRDPVGTVQQAVAALPVPKGLVLGWAIAMLLPLALYFVDLGAGSLSQVDAEVALLVRRVLSGQLLWDQAFHSVPPPTGGPLGIVPFVLLSRLFGMSEATLRLVPVLAALGAASCLLAIAIDVGVGRQTGGLAGLVFLAMPLTYELSHRIVPDMLVAVASTGAVALVSHSLHGHKFDRHILPMHKQGDEPAPLPLRRLPMLFAALGIGLAGVLDVRAGLVALFFGFFDCVISHRPLLRKRRVWLMWLGGTLLLLGASAIHGGALRTLFHRPAAGIFMQAFNAVWRQGPSWFGRHVGQVVVVTTCFGLLLGSMRRASRPLLVWVMLATLLTWVGGDLAPPRGLGLLLPPLALASAIGLQSPVRWLGSLGGLITTFALAGVVLAVIEGDPVIHQSDSVKTLIQSQRHAPATARRCVVGMNDTVAAYYSRRQIERFATVTSLKQAVGEKDLFSCLVPRELLPEMQRLLVTVPTQPQTPSPPPKPAQAKPVAKPPQPVKDLDLSAEPISTVLMTTLDIEEPPLDTKGPPLVLVTR